MKLKFDLKELEEGKSLNMETKTPQNRIYKLKVPVEFEGQRIETLSFVRPKGRHLKNLDLQKMKVGDLMNLGAQITGQRPKFFDELDASDIFAINEIISDFLVPGQ